MSVANNLFVEKYRPTTIEECILPARTKQTFEALVKRGEIPSLILAGSAGTGKTTVAKALCNELGADYFIINGSDESGIDTIRTKVKGFASTVSLMSESTHKVMIIDEADFLSFSAQPALRNMIEQYWKNCRFIFTCNFKNRLIDPLHSRSAVIDFTIEKDERAAIMAKFMARVLWILDQENIEYDPAVVAAFIKEHFPDFRRVLNELQRYSAGGKIDTGLLKVTGDDIIEEVISFLSKKNFKKMRMWIDMNSSIDIPVLFDKLYNKLPEFIASQSIPDMILILDEYQTKAPLATNQRINMAACMTQLMAGLVFTDGQK